MEKGGFYNDNGTGPKVMGKQAGAREAGIKSARLREAVASMRSNCTSHPDAARRRSRSSDIQGASAMDAIRTPLFKAKVRPAALGRDGSGCTNHSPLAFCSVVSKFRRTCELVYSPPSGAASGLILSVPKRLQRPVANVDPVLLRIMSSLQAHRTRLTAFLGREGTE
jgi:hypothetical protein